MLWKRFSARGRGENQADRALEQEIIPRPISEDEQTVAESNQVDASHASHAGTPVNGYLIKQRKKRVIVVAINQESLEIGVC